MFRHLILILLAGCAGCGSSSSTVPATEPEPSGPEWFKDVTTEVGLTHHLHVGPTGEYFMPQVMGSGVAIFDANNDGRPDILVLANEGPKSASTHRLFLQGEDGKFRDATAGSGLGIPGYGMGVAIGDFDNDGWLDVYISEYGGGHMFRNRGDGTFEDVTTTAGLAVPRWGTSCSFLDYDRDGWLDLVVVTYVDYDPSHACIDGTGRADYCHPNQFTGTATRLFHNRGCGPDGKWLGYEDVTATTGLAEKSSNGLGVVCADLDGDGWVDIFVANDATPNHLWINKGGKRFEERALSAGVAYNGLGNRMANMGVALADLHGTGRGDLFVTHLSEELHTLWKQDTPGRFIDVTAQAGLSTPRWRGTGFGTVAIDFDHDGWPDIVVVNGRVMRSRAANPPAQVRADLPAFWHSYTERNQLFVGTGPGKFADRSTSSPALCGQAAVFRGLAWADLDGDGAMDLVTTEIEGPVRVFKNVAPKAGHWLMVRAFDPALKRDALGATVRVRTGGRTLVGFVCPGQSYCSSGDMRVHFGLGPGSSVDLIQVDWPDGTHEVFPGSPADRHLVLKRGTGNPVRP
jgi:hypothetical protein